MTKLHIYLGMAAGGYAGWWLSDYLGFGIYVDLLISAAGSLLGVYVAWRLGRL
jgi:hypothetical protein